MEKTVESVVATVIAEVTVDGVVDVVALKEIIAGLNEVKKSASADAKALQKEASAAAKAEKAITGREFCANLAEGSRISWKNSRGQILTGTFIKMTDKSIHVEIDEAFLEEGKSKTARYLKGHEIVTE